jgi:hypothetical protein
MGAHCVSVAPPPPPPPPTPAAAAAALQPFGVLVVLCFLVMSPACRVECSTTPWSPAPCSPLLSPRSTCVYQMRSHLCTTARSCSPSCSHTHTTTALTRSQRYYTNLLYVLQNDPEPLALTFAVDEEGIGSTTSVDLKEGGSHIDVTYENRAEYVQLVCERRFVGRCSEQIRALRQGFNEVVPSGLLKDFDENELEVMIGGACVRVRVHACVRACVRACSQKSVMI